MEVTKRIRKTIATAGLLALAALGLNATEAAAQQSVYARGTVLSVSILGSGCYEYQRDATKIAQRQQKPDENYRLCVSQDPYVALASVEEFILNPRDRVPALEHREEYQPTTPIVHLSVVARNQMSAMSILNLISHTEQAGCAAGRKEGREITIDSIIPMETLLATDSSYATVTDNPCPPENGFVATVHTHGRTRHGAAVRLSEAQTLYELGELRDGPGRADASQFQKYQAFNREMIHFIVYAPQRARVVGGVSVQDGAAAYAFNADVAINDEQNVTDILRAFMANKTPPLNSASRLSLASYTDPKRGGNAIELSLWEQGVRGNARTNWTGDRTRIQFPQYRDYVVNR